MNGTFTGASYSVVCFAVFKITEALGGFGSLCSDLSFGMVTGFNVWDKTTSDQASDSGISALAIFHWHKIVQQHIRLTTKRLAMSPGPVMEKAELKGAATRRPIAKS